MQHETSLFPASLGDSFDYGLTSEYPTKQWSAFGELNLEINPCHTLNMIDEDDRVNFDIDSDSSCPQLGNISSSLSSTQPIEDSFGGAAPGLAPSWYNDNIDIDEILGNSTSEDPPKFIADNAANSISLLTSFSPSSPLMVSLAPTKQDVVDNTNIKKRKKNDEDEEKDKKKKEVSKKKKTQIQKEIEESHETDEDSGDNSGTQPKLTRKEKNKLAAQKYRAKQRNEASDIAKRCDMFVSENAQLKGEIETTKKQIEEYKKLLAQLNSPN